MLVTTITELTTLPRVGRVDALDGRWPANEGTARAATASLPPKEGKNYGVHSYQRASMTRFVNHWWTSKQSGMEASWVRFTMRLTLSYRSRRQKGRAARCKQDTKCCRSTSVAGTCVAQAGESQIGTSTKYLLGAYCTSVGTFAVD